MVIFRSLSPICILVRIRILFRFRYDLVLGIVYICILGSFESLLYIYPFVGSIVNCCNVATLIPPASGVCFDVHVLLGGRF